MNRPKRVAVVTGGNRGIGFELVRQLAKEGCAVVLTSRSAEAGQAAMDRLCREGLDVAAVPMDVTDPAGVRDAAAEVDRRFGRADVLINNAGVSLDRGYSIVKEDPSVMERTVDSNVMGPYRVMQAFYPLMERHGHGRIVNVSSGYGAYEETDSTGAAAYKLSKLALNGLTRLAAAAARGDIRINAVCPGWVRTDMGGPSAPRSAEQAARSMLWLTRAGPDVPNGGFFRDGRAIPW